MTKIYKCGVLLGPGVFKLIIFFVGVQQLLCNNSHIETSKGDADSTIIMETTSPSSSRQLRKRDDVSTHMAVDHPQGPYFGNGTATTVTAELGTSAYLHCQVRNLGDRTVSWVRRRDFHILTVGIYTYSSDQRFQMLNKEGSDDWTLQIKFTQKRDAGDYECQVSSDPPVIHCVTLHVVVAEAEIMGQSDLYFKSGSTITLMCLITLSPEPPGFVFWYHDSRMINYDTIRGGISVNTVKGVTTVSTVVITNAQRSDSGNYSCKPTNAETTSVTVHVLNGEKPEAIQHDAETSCATQLTQKCNSGVQLLAICHTIAVLLQTLSWNMR